MGGAVNERPGYRVFVAQSTAYFEALLFVYFKERSNETKIYEMGNARGGKSMNSKGGPGGVEHELK